MADIKEFQIGSNVYQFKDETARNSISALQAAVGSPLVANTAASMSDTTKIYVYTGSETGYTTGHWYYHNGSAWTDGGTYQSAGIGAGTINGQKLSDDLKDAFLAIVEHIAFTDANGQTYYNNLVNAFNSNAILLSISAVFNSGTDVIYDNDTLDDLKQYLTVTAYYDDGTSHTVSGYTLSGTLAVGTSTITVSYGGKTATFNVTVESEQWTYSSLNDGVVINGTFANAEGSNTKMCLDVRANTRRSLALTSGDGPVALVSGNDTYTNPTNQNCGYYPIPIPKGATQVKCSVTPSTQYIQVLSRVLDNGVYSTMTTQGMTGYQEGTITKTFDAVTARNYGFAFVTTKYDNAGTSYPTEPTEIKVEFS